MRNVVKKQTLQAVNDHWDEISTKLPSDTNKDDLLDKLRKYIDRLTNEKVKDLGEKVATSVVVQTILELLKNPPSL